MAIIIKHFVDLQNYKFNIPAYQRGYRWEKKQVDDLLNDLVEFVNASDNTKSFYCLQPVVVTKNKALSEQRGYDVFDLIDGQQRLTTLLLVFEHIVDQLPNWFTSALYSIEYERKETPIDDFFIGKARETIIDWFKINGDYLKADIAKSLCPLKVLNAMQNQKAIPEECHDVRVIWYDIDEETQAQYGKNMESVDIFNRLNYGKTRLTSTELIKALLFQCDQYPDSKIKLRQQIAFSRSCEWDIMEKQLQNPYIWGMLGSPNNTAHIDILLSFVVRRLLEENPNLGQNIRKDDDFNYRIINDFIGDDIDQLETNVDYIWQMIQDSYIVFMNWYNKQQWYHLVGVLLAFMRLRTKANITQESVDLIYNIYKLYINHPKSKFTDLLKQEIGKKVKISSKISENSIMYQTASDKGRLYKLEEICYGECNQEIIRILLLQNVDVALHATNEQVKFPFHLFYKCKTTSLEHIHPQNLSLDDLKFEDLVKWMQRKKEELFRIGKFEKMKECFQLLEKAQEEQEKDNKWFNEENNRRRCQEEVTKIDKFFNELSDIEEIKMHTICNMALVDKDTNAALQNYLLDKKRTILKEREYLTPENPILIPIATKKVFNKDFNKSPKDLQYWTQEDRDGYFAEIKRVYEEYTNVK